MMNSNSKSGQPTYVQSASIPMLGIIQGDQIELMKNGQKDQKNANLMKCPIRYDFFWFGSLF